MIEAPPANPLPAVTVSTNAPANCASIPPANATPRYKDMLKKYTEGLTIHGLSTIFHGSSLEKQFWGVCLVAAIVLTYFVSKTFFIAFAKQEVVSDFREKPVNS